MTTLAPATPQRSDVRIRRGSRGSLFGGVALAVIVVLMAVVVPFNFSLGTLTNLVGLFTLIILGTTWNLLAGYGGLVSIGQQSFIGAGGYACVAIANHAGLNPIIAVLLAGLVCAALAYPTSFLLFRLVGGYFAVGTWVVAEVYRLVTTQIHGLGGGSGLTLTAFADVDHATRIGEVYWTALTLAIAAVLGTWLLMRSRWGLGLAAVRDEPIAAAGLGVAVRRSQRIVYVLAAGGAGMAGALIATDGLGVTPDSIYSVNYTAFMIFIVVIGGIGSVEGPVLGAVIFYLLQQRLQDHGLWYLIVLGCVAILVVLTAPRGLWGLITRDGRYELFPISRRVERIERSS